METMDNLDIITVKAPNQSQKHFQREGRGLKLSTIQRHYANAVGVMYEKNNVCISASLDDKEIIIPKDVLICTVDYPEGNKDQDTTQKGLNEKKRSRVKDIISEYENASKNKEENDPECVPSKKKVWKIPKVEKKVFKVAWQHWQFGHEKPKTVSAPYGCEKTMELYTDQLYSFEYIKQRCIDLFPRIRTDKEVKDCKIQLAVPGSKVIDNFYDEAKQTCDLWKAKNVKDSARRLHFYIITTETKSQGCSTIVTHPGIIEPTSVLKRNSGEKNSTDEKAKSNVQPSNIGINTELRKNSALYDLTNFSKPSGESVTDTEFLKKYPAVVFAVPDGPAKKKKVDLQFSTSLVKIDLTEGNSEVIDVTKKHLKIDNVREMKISMVNVVPYEHLNVKTEEKLGEGAFGTVYVGEWLKDKIAVKSLHSVSKYGTSRDQLILREVSVLTQLSHKNLIKIRAVSITETEPAFHIAMEFFESKNLYSFIHSGSLLELKNQHFIAHQICQAIYYLHNNPRQIVHKDIKPSNVLVNSNFEVKVCDFGLSTSVALDTALKSTHEKKGEGTPCYMAPEVFTEMESPSMSSDVWSLACTLIELYRLKPLWGDSVTQATIAFKFFKKQLPDLSGIPASLVTPYLEKCLSYEPRERPPVGILTDALANLRGLD